MKYHFLLHIYTIRLSLLNRVRCELKGLVKLITLFLCYHAILFKFCFCHTAWPEIKKFFTLDRLIGFKRSGQTL